MNNSNHSDKLELKHYGKNNPTTHNRPNTIVLRDNDGASRLSSIILSGADYLNKHVNSSLLTNGFLYLTNNKYCNEYAILRNLEEDHLNVSLDIGQNNANGNFSIRTIQPNNITTNVCIKNNKIGINNNNPAETLDVTGNGKFSGTLNVGSTIKTIISKGVVFSSTIGELYSGKIDTIDIADSSITSEKLGNNIQLPGTPTCNTDANVNLSIANVKYVNDLIDGVLQYISVHYLIGSGGNGGGSVLQHISINNSSVFVNNGKYVIDYSIDNISLPTNMIEGFQLLFINKTNKTLVINSSDSLFNILYSPYGSTEFFFEHNRCIELIYIYNGDEKSWSFKVN
jgi:hypothetical protein